MCKVHICTPHGTFKVSPADLDPKVRLAWAVELMESWHKPKLAVSQQSKPVAKVRQTAAPAPLQCGGDREKSRSSARWNKDDSTGHYRMRCNQSNDRNKTCGLRKRHLQVECW